MKNLFVVATLIGAVASALFSLPCSAATETQKVIYFQPPSGGTRIPHTGNSGGFVTLNVPGFPIVDPSVPAGSHPVLLVAEPTLMINGTNYALAFASILGSNEGGVTAFPNSSGFLPFSVPVDVGSANLTVNYVYFPVGGPCLVPPCTGGSGAWLGEMDEMSGDLLWDYFVTVYSPQSASSPDAVLTHNGNIYGTVSTTAPSPGVRINAYATTTTGGNFDRWSSEPVMPNMPSSRDLDVNSQTSTIALAAYHSACPPGYSWSPSQYVSQCTASSGPTIPRVPIEYLCAEVPCQFGWINDVVDPAPDKFVNGIVAIGGQILGVRENNGVIAEVFVSRGTSVKFVGTAEARKIAVSETDRSEGFGSLKIGATEKKGVLVGLALDARGRFIGTLSTRSNISQSEAAKAGIRP